ncbi:hypothetical protein GBF38_009289, partial [Nibea albiflora]
SQSEPSVQQVHGPMTAAVHDVVAPPHHRLTERVGCFIIRHVSTVHRTRDWNFTVNIYYCKINFTFQ